MPLQLQFRADGIIGLLSQSIASLLKLISMMIHWNHHENTLSWWVFTSQCSSREWNHPYKKACYPKYQPGPFSCSSGEQCREISQQFWKTLCPFLETASWFHFYPQFPRSRNANFSLDADIVMRTKYWACADPGPNLQSPIHSTNIHSVSFTWLQANSSASLCLCFLVCNLRVIIIWVVIR